MATTLSSLNSLTIADVGTRTENWALMINNLFSYINTLEAGTAAHPNVVTAALKLTTSAGANKILQSDADGDLTYTLTPNLTSLEIDTLKVTTSAGANKLLVSDADGDLTYTLTPNLTSLEIDTLKVTTSAGANKLLVSDAAGDLTYTLAPNLTSLEVDTLKVTTSAGANKLLVSDAAGDLTYTLTPNLTSLEVDTLKVTTGAGANSVLVSDADGDASWTLTPNLTSLEVDTLKITTGAAANKLLSSDADGDCAWTATPTLTTLEVGTVKITGGSPGADKVLTSDADGDASWETAGGGGSGDFSNNGENATANRTLGNNDAYDLGFETSNTTRMTIESGGHIGVGITNPTAAFHAVGTDMIFDCNNFYKKYSGNTTLSVDYLGRLSIFEALASPTAGTARTGGMLNIDIGSGSNVSRGMDFHSARPDANGQMHTYTQRSPSPAHGDAVLSINVQSTGIRQTYFATSGQLQHRSTSIGTAGGDGRTDDYQSEWRFYVCNNVDEAGDYDGSLAVNVYGLVNYSGAFVDSSAGVNKLFDDNYTDRYGTICDTLSSLRICTYRSAKGPEDRSYSFGTTAEEFYETFGIGDEPQMMTNKDGVEEYRAGIAAKDPAFLALAAVKELHARLKVLENA